MIKKDFINNLQMKEMIMTQLNSWELVLRKKKLADSTVDRKINNVGCFYMYLQKRRSEKEKVNIDNISDLAFEYVSNGLFSDINYDNEGTYGYRVSIYNNVKEGFKYIYEGKFNSDEVIKELTNEQKDILNDISKNKWFKISDTEKVSMDINSNIQVKLLEDLGIKIYFDENNKPYALSHELAELIDKENKIIMRDIRNLLRKINENNFVPVSKSTDFTMVEDIYLDSKQESRPTYKLYKDLLLTYVLGLTGKDIIKFKMKYIDAFNYIEQQHEKLLKEHMELKEAFLKMYNDIRKRNRDLLILDHNKKCETKKNSKSQKSK